MTFENFSPSEPARPALRLVKGRPRAALARAEGRVEISYRLRGQKTALAHLYQRGCGRVRFPDVGLDIFPEGVLINTAGGLTGGDVMSYDISLEPGAGLTITSQAAEKIYRSTGDAAALRAKLTLGPGSILEWLPQETILFNDGNLDRLNEVELAADSRLLVLEAVVFGRPAHGEKLTSAYLKDGWRIRRDGRLLWYDNFTLGGDIESLRKRPALLDGAGAMATLLLADPKAADYLDLARELAADVPGRAGVSHRDGLLIMRVMTPDGYRLRKAVTPILEKLRAALGGHPGKLPKVWENQS